MSVSSAGIMAFSAEDRDQSAPELSEATRYLAAAAHLDPVFRRAVLQDICHNKYRCKAPEFGMDEQTVIEECRIADRRWKVREGLLLALLVVFVIASNFVQDLAYVMSDAPEEFPLLLQVHWFGLFLLAITGAAVLFGDRLMSEHFTLRKRFTRRQFHAHDRRQTRTRQNLVVYGGFSPFVGSGLSLRNWSFSVNLQKATEGGLLEEASGLSVTELAEFIQARLASLTIAGFEQYQVLFADGRYVRDDQRLMPSPYELPPRQIPEELIAAYSQDEETRRRAYLRIAVTDWSGEMVITTYLRFKKGESHLFAESSSFILPPLKQGYYIIDSMTPSLRIKRVAQLVMGSLAAAPFRLVWSPFSVLGIIMQPIHDWRARRQTRKAIRDNPLFNYGALTSIRQLGMEDRFRVYFQQLDRDMHLKTVEQCMIDAIVTYLEERGIDTSDIRERRHAILNNGVFISGGVVNAESLTAGAGARSIISKVQSLATAAKKG